MKVINIIEYIRIPNATLRRLLRLGKTLIIDMPELDNPLILDAAKDLQACIAEVEQGLTERHDELNPESGISLMDFDRAVDGLWVFLRLLLEGCEAYAHAGLDALSNELKIEAKLPEARKIAAIARSLRERLFGSDGTKFVKLTFIDQAEEMATILRLIEQEALSEDLETVVGPVLPRLIAKCQVHYEAMVSERLSRPPGSGQNLRLLRAELSTYLTQYCNAVVTLYKPKQPETAELVTTALRAVPSLRRQLLDEAAGLVSADPDDDEAELGPSELDELDELNELDELDELNEPAPLDAEGDEPALLDPGESDALSP
jgi:hypothetical protein